MSSRRGGSKKRRMSKRRGGGRPHPPRPMFPPLFPPVPICLNRDSIEQLNLKFDNILSIADPLLQIKIMDIIKIIKGVVPLHDPLDEPLDEPVYNTFGQGTLGY